MFVDGSQIVVLIYSIHLFSSRSFGSLLVPPPPKVPPPPSRSIDLHATISQLEPSIPNYCNNSKLIEQSGLIRAPMGQFLGFPCSNEFYHCRWQSDGYRTHRKNCRAGLVYDVMGTQNCNYDYNVKGCSMNPTGTAANCTSKDFECPLSEDCVPLSKRCDGNYDCVLEEDEQNCPMCKATHFPCVVSEQCIPLGQRCNGIKECQDGTDELDCENCGAGKFLCRKSGKCISAKDRCDGFAQCPHGEDEQLCKKSRILLGPRMFLCENGKHQIPQQNVCDGIVHCPDDASDEKYCQRATKAPAIEFEVQSPPTVQPPAIEAKLEHPKIVFDQPPSQIGGDEIGPQDRPPQQMPAESGNPMKKAQKPLAATSTKKQVDVIDNVPMTMAHPTVPIPNNQPPLPPSIGAFFPRFTFNASSMMQNQPPPANTLLMPIKGGPTNPMLNNFGNNFGKNGNGNSPPPPPPPPPTLTIQMSNLKKMLAASTVKMMDQIPPFQFQKQPQRQMAPNEKKPRTFVQGDFQAGVWNGSAYAQQQPNPYADEWFSQFGQQQIEQNNLVQEETADGGQWPSVGNYGVQQMNGGQPRQQQINEQRRAVKEEMERNEEPTKQGEGGRGGGDGQQATINSGGPSLVEGGMDKKDDDEEEEKQGKTQLDEERHRDESESSPSSTQMGMPMPIMESAALPIPNENPMENPWRKANSSNGKGEDGRGDGKVEEGTNEGGNGGGRLLEEGAKREEARDEAENGRQNVWTVTMPDEQNSRIKGETEESVEGGEEMVKGDEQKILKNAAERVGGGAGMNFGPNPTAEMIAKKKGEEEEQREILKRLYDKFGANAKDLLRRLENLLMLAETGIVAKNVEKSEDADEGGQTRTTAEQHQQQMRRRHVQQRRDIVRQYMASVMGREIGNKKYNALRSL